MIGREASDLDSLEKIGKRAMADSDVRDDFALQGMIKASLQRRLADLQQAPQARLSSTTDSQPRPTWRTELPKPVRESFHELAQALDESLERREGNATQAIFGKMQALQKANSEVIPLAALEDYQQRVERLRLRVDQLAEEVEQWVQRAVVAARTGSEQELARSMRRLTAIHAAHPLLLDEPGLEDVRSRIADAADERRRHDRTTQKLLERERAITGEIKKLAVAVRAFHQVARSVPASSEDFQKAEATYLQVVQTVKTFDTEWFSGVVLDLADLLAEWTVPPLDAEGQIDRFLDSISAGLDKIRVEMRQISSEQGPRNGGGSESPV